MSREKDWLPEYFDNLVSFYADPSDQRTFKKFCEDNGYNDATINQYKRVHGDILWPAVDSVRAKYIPRIRTEAYNSVFANIKKSFNDRRLALQLCGDLIERSEISNTIKTPEEKRAAIELLMSKLSEKVDSKTKSADKISTTDVT